MEIIEARRRIINSQGFNGDYSDGKQGVLDVINQLGYVQIDTIHVIKRAHEHVIFSRFPQYKSGYIKELMRERNVFEYWTHAMAILPIESYQYTLRRKSHFKWRYKEYNTPAFKKLTNHVYERIKEEGCLESKDFKDSSGRKAIWEWKPAKAALETLYHQGKIMVSHRENFRRFYDLTERIMPDYISSSIPSQKEAAKYQIERALKANGVMTSKEICSTLIFADDKEIEKQLNAQVNKKKLKVTKIAGQDHYYINEKIPDNLPQQMVFLSPFDNMIINRKRLKRFFDIDYRLECYMPVSKRTLGYFVLPILYGDEICGFIDLKADRKKKELIIKILIRVRQFTKRDEKLLDESLERFAIFNGCNSIQIAY